MNIEPETAFLQCPFCAEPSLSRNRIERPSGSVGIDALACASCGEWWFEAGGRRLTPETIIKLGLAG